MNFLYLGLGIILFFYILWKWKNRVILITHSGDYHLDEVFSTVVLLKKIKKKGKFHQLIRTRDKNIFRKWRRRREKGQEVYIYDVGHIYDENKNEFDHHQKGGAGERENGIKYSSAGLVWKKFGEEIMGSKDLAWKIEKKLVMAIDALDNGQEISEPKYDFFQFDLTNLIKLFSPKNKQNQWKMKKAFCKSVRLLDFILDKEIKITKKLAKDEKKLDEIYQNTKDKRVLIIRENISTSAITEKYPEVLFLINQKEKDVWIIQTIVKKWGSFERRKYLPKTWASLEEEELDKVTGVDGGIFCHKDAFIASAKTLEAAEEMVQIALSNEE